MCPAASEKYKDLEKRSLKNICLKQTATAEKLRGYKIIITLLYVRHMKNRNIVIALQVFWPLLCCGAVVLSSYHKILSCLLEHSCSLLLQHFSLSVMQLLLIC